MMEDKHKWEIVEDGNTDFIYVDRKTLIYFDVINKLFEEIKETLKYNPISDVERSYLADYAVQKTDELFGIINSMNTKGSVKYVVSKLELKKNND